MNIEKWDIETLIDACSSKPKGHKKLKIPKFQRRREWKSYQEDELIETMKSNQISIGVLQLYKLDFEKKMEIYLLVDGLHRVTTLSKYFKNPFSFGRTKKLIDNIANEIVQKYEKSYDKDELKKLCDKWFNEKNLESYQEFVVDKTYSDSDKSDYLEKIISKLSDKKDKDNMCKMFKTKTKVLRDSMDISKSIIPVILNVGDISILPILFKRINQNGTPLTPCDVLAAKWYASDKIEVKNKDIVECIKTYYSDMRSENNGMEIYNNDNDNNTMFTTYEYIIGLKRYLFDQFEDTFLEHITNKEFMFKLLSCCFFGNMSKKSIERIREKITEENLSELEKKLEWSIKFVADALDPIIIFKTGDKCKILIREVPIILGLITLSYKYKTQIEKNKDYYKKIFQMNLLNDKISETNFNTQIIKSILKNKKYLSRVHKEEFIGKFNGYISNGIKQRGKNDKITTLSQFVLMFVKNIKDNSEEYELGNIVLKKKINEFNKENKGKQLPLNFLGNLCLYGYSEEKRKPKETIVEYLNKQNISDNDIYENVLYMGENIDYDDIIQQQEITEKYYIQFLKVRSGKIRDIIINEYKKCFVDENNNEEEKNPNIDPDSNEGSDDESNEENESDGGSDNESDNEENEKQPVKIKINKDSNNRVILMKKND